MFERFHPDFHDIIRDRSRHVADGTRSAPFMEQKYLRLDGTPIDVEVSAVPFNYQGESGALVFVRDITERKLAEERILKLSRALEQSPTLVMITDKDGRIEYVNPKFTEVTGYSLEEIRGKKPGFLKSGSTPREEYDRIWKTILAGGRWEGEFRNRKKDGSFFWEQASIGPIRNSTGDITAFLGVKEDITNRKTLEAELRQAQKMESVGRLAGGVAHDFNNLLTAINGYAQFLLQTIPDGDARRGDVQEILAAGARAALLTRQLLAFSRKQILNPATLDLNGIIGGTVKMLKRIIGEDIGLETRLAPKPCLVRVDAGQIGQVLLNLAVNARDAMPNGGTLSLETETLKADEYGAAPPDLRGKPLVRLTVRDTGCGMTEEIKGHLFEPFYTTKDKGKGTGLGLSTAYGIIKQSGGDIEIESETGKGTLFRIYLPKTDPPPPGVEPGGAVEAASQPRGSETILFVEDEELLRRLGARILASCGYKVLTAADGEDALRALERHGRAVDVLITDVVMPGMSGRDLGREIARRELAGRTLYISGYTDDAIVRHGVLETGLAFMYKPFSPDTLARKVREVLDGPPDQAWA